jgi:hypothetical protein
LNDSLIKAADPKGDWIMGTRKNLVTIRGTEQLNLINLKEEICISVYETPKAIALCVWKYCVHLFLGFPIPLTEH